MPGISMVKNENGCDNWKSFFSDTHKRRSFVAANEEFNDSSIITRRVSQRLQFELCLYFGKEQVDIGRNSHLLLLLQTFQTLKKWIFSTFLAIIFFNIASKSIRLFKFKSKFFQLPEFEIIWGFRRRWPIWKQSINGVFAMLQMNFSITRHHFEAKRHRKGFQCAFEYENSFKCLHLSLLFGVTICLIHVCLLLSTNNLKK